MKQAEGNEKEDEEECERKKKNGRGKIVGKRGRR